MAQRMLLVASLGGHLQELHQLSKTLVRDDDDVVWVTADGPQSRSLLADAPSVVHIAPMRPRDYGTLVRSVIPAIRILLRQRPDVVVSTGACVALAFLPFAWLVGAQAIFIESAARTRGPSLTGRLLALLPWVRLRTQHPAWSGRRWEYFGSVFDSWRAAPGRIINRPIRRVVVTTGTQEGYPFVSLVEAVRRIVPEDVEVRYQVGGEFPAQLRPPGARDVISQREFDEWIRWSDVVVAHAGVGSAMTLFAAGRVPVLCPRRGSRGEHVDNHQRLIADELAGRGLVITAEPDALTWQHLVAAATASVRPALEPALSAELLPRGDGVLQDADQPQASVA